MILSRYEVFLYSTNNNVTFLSKFSAISVQSDIPIRLKGQISERTSEFVIQDRFSAVDLSMARSVAWD